MSILRTGNKMERITDALSTLTVNVKLHNSRGRTDINAVAEDFYCGLLNIVLGKNLSNLNALQMDFPAIDLADWTGRLCVQVTSTEGREKVSHTLEKFYERDMERDFDRLLILIIGEKKKYRGSFREKGQFRLDPKEDIWDTAKLLGEIERLDDKRQTEVDEYLQTHLNIPRSGPAPMNLPLRASLGIEGFVGRGEELARMAEALKAGVKPLVIWGLGGMGKTELVCHFGSGYRGGRVYFALFRDSFRDTVTQSITPGIPELRDRELTGEQRYALTMDRLRRCDKGDILIIDNVDREKGGFVEFEKDSAYKELRELPMHVIITTRMQVRDGIHVPALENSKLYQIFRRHEVLLPQQEMDNLIEAVNGHTMTVDLIARTLDESWEEVTPRMILDAMANSTLPEEDYPEVYSDHDQNQEQRQIYAHLRALFNLTGIPEDGKYALRCAALLPIGGMDPKLFRAALPAGPREEIKLLEKRGWVRRANHLLTIHPVVRLVCKTELKPTDENCGAFLDGLWLQIKRDDYDKDTFLQLAELYAGASDDLGDRLGNWALWAGRFWNLLGEARRALDYDLRMVAKREQNQPDSNELATAYNNVGLTYGDLGDHERALEYLLKALAIFEKVLPRSHPDLAVSYNNVGGTYGALGDRKRALEYLLKALAIREKVLPRSHPDLALSYNNVGSTYGALGDHERALEYGLKALAIWEKVLPRSHPDLARSYNNVGGTYGALGDHKRALEYHQKALAIREKVLPRSHPDLAQSYNNVGSTYGDLGDHKRALEYKQKALAIREKVLSPEHPDLAQSYGNLSYTYGELGDGEKELEYDLKAFAIREKVLPPTHPDLAVSCNNLAWTYYKMGQYEQALAYIRRAANIAEKSLPEGHPHLKIYRESAEWLEREVRQLRGEE